MRDEHIVEVFDIGVMDDGRPFVVMERLFGESLAERLLNGRVLSEQDLLSIARQLAEALSVAHERGIVHRDIKPENIFLCPRSGHDFVKLLDFGISKALEAEDEDDGEPPGSAAVTRGARLTRTGAVLGTPLYMSPEQARGEPLDGRTDVYGLGVVMYECLTGTVPFLAANYLGVVAKILTEEIEPPSARNPERPIGAGLERVVMHALATDRTQRYQTMSALLLDVERVAEGHEPVGPHPQEGMHSHHSPPLRRLARRELGLGLFGLLILGAGAVLIVRDRPVPPAVVLPARSPLLPSSPPEHVPAVPPRLRAESPPRPPPDVTASRRDTAMDGAGSPLAEKPRTRRTPPIARAEKQAQKPVLLPLVDEQAPNPFSDGSALPASR